MNNYKASRQLSLYLSALSLGCLIGFASQAPGATNVCEKFLQGLTKNAPETAALPQRTVNLPDSVSERLCKERVCIKSFPWTPKAHDAFFSEDKAGWDFTLSSALRQDVHNALDNFDEAKILKLKQLPITKNERQVLMLLGKNIEGSEKYIPLLSPTSRALWQETNTLSIVDREVFGLVMNGADPEQIRLYADFLHCSTAVRENKIDDIIRCVVEAKKRSGLEMVKQVIATNVEEATYFSKQSLINMLSNFEYLALSEGFKGNISEAISLISRYLDDASVLSQHAQISGDASSKVLGILTDDLVKKLALDEPAWKRMQALNKVESLQGFMNDEEGVTLLIGQNRMHAIRDEGFGWEVVPETRVKLLFQQHCEKQMASVSTDTMQLFYTHPTEDGRVIQFPKGRTVKLSTSEEALLKEGKPLPAESQLSQALSEDCNHMLYSTPLMEKQSAALSDADSFTFALQRAYPKSKFVRDPISAQTALNTNKLSKYEVSKPSDLLVVVSDPKVTVPQSKTIANIAADLKALNVNVTMLAGGEKYQGQSGKAVFVITGHSSEELAGFVRQVGEGGFLKDNYVIFNSCETALTRELITEINGRFGAVATYAFEGKIMASSVQDYLLTLAGYLDGKMKFNLLTLLNDMVQKHNLNGIFTICKINPTNPWKKPN